MFGGDMTFSERARDFVKNDETYKELVPLLIDCIVDGGVDALAAVLYLAATKYDFAGGSAFQYEAAYALLAWKEKGLETLHELAYSPGSIHNFSISTELLSAIAAGEVPKSHAHDDISAIVKKAIGDPQCFSAKADQLLKKVIRESHHGEDAIFRLSSLFSFSSREDEARIQRVISAVSPLWLAVGQPVIDRYLALLLTHADDERVFQSFFEENPLMLDPLAVRVWSKPDFHGKKEPDFIVKRADNSYLIIEIETPSKQLVTREKQLGAKVTQAVTQAMEYRSFLLERYQQAELTFPDFSPPEALVIIGLENELTEEERLVLRRENEHRAHLKVIGFDAVSDRLQAIVKNLAEGEVRVDKVRLA